jgi:hypothetical protein
MKELLKELKDLGYTQEEISEELEIMSTQKSIIYEKVSYPVWSLPEEDIEPQVEPEILPEEPGKEQKVEVKHMIIEEPSTPDKEKLRAAFGSEKDETTPAEITSSDDSLEEVIISYLKEKELVATKPQFIEDITSMGYDKMDVENKINSLKEKGIIAYSRSKPKGWSLLN